MPHGNVVPVRVDPYVLNGGKAPLQAKSGNSALRHGDRKPVNKAVGLIVQPCAAYGRIRRFVFHGKIKSARNTIADKTYVACAFLHVARKLIASRITVFPLAGISRTAHIRARRFVYGKNSLRVRRLRFTYYTLSLHNNHSVQTNHARTGYKSARL